MRLDLRPEGPSLELAVIDCVMPGIRRPLPRAQPEPPAPFTAREPSNRDPAPMGRDEEPPNRVP